MKTKLHRTFSAAGLAAAAFLTLATLSAARTRSTTVFGPRGGVYQRQVSHTPGHLSASGSATLPNGKTATRNVTSDRTDTGRTTSAQVTGFNGKTATYNSTRTNTANGYTRQATATGPNGGAATKTVDVSQQNGTITRSVTTTVTPPTH